MSDSGSATVSEIWRYPVKGLAGQRLASVDLTVGDALPYDRAWAIENGAGRFDPANPQHLPKINFLMLMRDERLATLGTQFDAASETLTILRDGKQVAKGVLNQPIGRTMLEQFFAAYMKTELRGAPKFVHAPGHRFADLATQAVHIVNLATVREVAEKIGQPLDPQRFRANVYIDGLPAWSEFDWVDRNIAIGDVMLRGFARTDRCDATNVNPQTAARDLSLTRQLQRVYGHVDIGIYATVKSDGRIAEGQTVSQVAD